MNTTWEKTIVLNVIGMRCQELNFDSLLTKNSYKVSSSSPLKMGIHKQEVAFFYTGHMTGGATTYK